MIVYPTSYCCSDWYPQFSINMDYDGKMVIECTCRNCELELDFQAEEDEESDD